MNTWREHPFRVFFLLATIGAGVALWQWILLILAPKSAFFPLHWHAVAFLNLCAGAGFAGFLLTAMPEWVKRFPMKNHAYVLIGLWLAILFGLNQFKLALFMAILFWLYLSLLIAYWLYLANKPKFISYLLILMALLFLNIDYFIRQKALSLYLMVDVMIIAIGMVNFRVGNVLGNEALQNGGLKDWRYVPNLHAKNIAILILSFYCFCIYFEVSQNILGWLALAVSSAFLGRLNEWHHLFLLREHFVRANYGVNLSIFLGYLGVGLSQLFYPALYSFSRHLLAISAMLAMVLIIMSIAGVRHSGLKLYFYRDTRFAIGLLLFAGFCRSFLAYYYPHFWTIYIIPTFCVLSAFLLYLIRYLIIFAQTDPR